jgi:D-3-phosphoglycerate dehydrogenase / 2-oxoglutarate reductase
MGSLPENQLPVVAQVLPMIHAVGVEALEGVVDLRTAESLERADVLRVAADAVGLIIVQPFTVDGEFLDALPNLSFLVAWGSGVDGFDVQAATDRGIPLFSNRGVGAHAIAEHALGAMVILLRGVRTAERDFRATGQFLPRVTYGHSVQQSTLGVIGLGFIGRHVVKCASAGFGMKVVVFDPYVDDAVVAELGARRVELAELLGVSDVVSVHCPLTAQTTHLMGKDQLAAMKPGAIVINTSRGAVFDQPALVEALQNGHVGGAALDVFAEEEVGTDPRMPLDHPLFSMENVMLTPHCAGRSFEKIQQTALGVAANVKTALAGGSGPQLVNRDVDEGPRRRLEAR